MHVEVEFRDGAKLVPAHVADLLERYDTTTMTYDEAIKRANTELARRVANDAQDRAIAQHRERFG